MTVTAPHNAVTTHDGLSLPLPPDYARMRSIVVDQPLQLKGRYDQHRITQLRLSREDGIALPIEYAQGHWELWLASGWTTPGAHWLHMQGMDQAGHIITAQTFYFIVCADAVTAATTLRLRALRNTWFKATPQDSTQLSPAQIAPIAAGQTLTVLRYGLSGAHFKLVLAQPISPIGCFGYISTTGAELLQGDTTICGLPPGEMPAGRCASAQLKVRHPTYLKAQLADAAHLATDQKRQLPQGHILPLTQYTRYGDHWQVSLPIANCPNPAFIAAADVSIICEGQPITCGPAELTIEILCPTPIQQESFDLETLRLSEGARLAAGVVHNLSGFILTGKQLQVQRRSPNSLPFALSYLDPTHVQLRRGNQVIHPVNPQVELHLPGRDNVPQHPDREWPIVNIMTLAAVLSHYGMSPTADAALETALLDWCFTNYGPGSQVDHQCLTALLAAHDYQLEFRRNWTTAELCTALTRQMPVVVHSRFTPAQHLIALCGYGQRGWLVYDPWGDATTGYRCLDGDRVWYSTAYLSEMVGGDGAIVAAAVQPTPN